MIRSLIRIPNVCLPSTCVFGDGCAQILKNLTINIEQSGIRSMLITQRNCGSFGMGRIQISPSYLHPTLKVIAGLLISAFVYILKFPQIVIRALGKHRASPTNVAH